MVLEHCAFFLAHRRSAELSSFDALYFLPGPFPFTVAFSISLRSPSVVACPFSPPPPCYWLPVSCAIARGLQRRRRAPRELLLQVYKRASGFCGGAPLPPYLPPHFPALFPSSSVPARCFTLFFSAHPLHARVQPGRRLPVLFRYCSLVFFFVPVVTHVFLVTPAGPSHPQLQQSLPLARSRTSFPYFINRSPLPALADLPLLCSIHRYVLLPQSMLLAASAPRFIDPVIFAASPFSGHIPL